MPPPVRIELLAVDPAPPRPGSVFTFRYGLGPVERRWTVRLVEREAGRRFRDETLRGPLSRFLHTHTFEPGRHGTWIVDEVDFHVGPDGPLGAVLDVAAGGAMRATFIWRAMRQRQLLR